MLNKNKNKLIITFFVVILFHELGHYTLRRNIDFDGDLRSFDFLN